MNDDDKLKIYRVSKNHGSSGQTIIARSEERAKDIWRMYYPDRKTAAIRATRETYSEMDPPKDKLVQEGVEGVIGVKQDPGTGGWGATRSWVWLMRDPPVRQ